MKSRQRRRLADFAECPEYVFVDARTFSSKKDIEPRLRDFEYLGDNKIRVTYEWVVKYALNQDYQCFVHFINEESANAGKIEFQQDHATLQPTSQWQKGQVVVDGPYEISVPAANSTPTIWSSGFSRTPVCV